MAKTIAALHPRFGGYKIKQTLARSRLASETTLNNTQGNWDSGQSTFYFEGTTFQALPIAVIDGIPGRMFDAVYLTDFEPGAPPATITRRGRRLSNKQPNKANQHSKRVSNCAAAWRTEPDTIKAQWTNAALELNTSAKATMLSSSVREKRDHKPRSYSGFALYLMEYRAAGDARPLSPNDPDRIEGLNMSEILTDADYTIRLMALLRNTTGAVRLMTYSATASKSTTIPTDRTDLIDELRFIAKMREVKVILANPTTAKLAPVGNTDAKTQLIEAGASCRLAPGNPLMHAKIWLVEPNYVIVGSHNLTQAAAYKNVEVSVLISKQSHYDYLLSIFNDLYDLST